MICRQPLIYDDYYAHTLATADYYHLLSWRGKGQRHCHLRPLAIRLLPPIHHLFTLEIRYQTVYAIAI